jgi:tetratricopeptide (TPR) repeat protein
MDTLLLQSVLEFYEKFASQNSRNPRLQGEAAWAYRKVGVLYHNLGRDEEAETAYARSRVMFEELIEQFPADRGFRFRLVETTLMADPWTADEHTLDALVTRLRRARDLVAGLSDESPENQEYAQARIQTAMKLGALFDRTGRMDEAEQAYREAITMASHYIHGSSRAERFRLDSIATRQALASLQSSRGHRDEALANMESIVLELQPLIHVRGVSQPVIDHLQSIAELYRSLGEPARALELERQADAVRAEQTHERHEPRTNSPPPPSHDTSF